MGHPLLYKVWYENYTYQLITPRDEDFEGGKSQLNMHAWPTRSMGCLTISLIDDVYVTVSEEF